MLRPFAVCSLLLLGGCASVAWNEPPAGLPTSWRHYQLFAGPHALVLARDASAAADGHRLAETAATAITAELGHAPPRGLVLALSAEDPLPIADPTAYVETVRDWQQTLTGQRPPPPSFTPPQQPGKPPVELDPAQVMHLLATGIPKHDHGLDLPPDLVAAAGFLALLPTDACLATTCDAIFDAACAAQGISKLTILAAAVVGGHPATLMRKSMQEVRRVALLEAIVPALAVPPADLPGLRQRLALPNRGGLPTFAADEPLSAAQTEQVRHIEAQGTWAAADGSGFVVRKRPAPELQGHLVAGPWQIVVDLGLARDHLGTHVANAAKTYLRYDCLRVLPTRADAEAFDALLQQHRHEGVLLVADDPERAAALVAAHAFYVRRLDAAVAVDLARRCGGAVLVDDLGRVFANQPTRK